VIGGVLRAFVLPLALGALIVLAVTCTYWVMEPLLASRTDYVRGLWEGAVVVTVVNAGNAIARRVIRHVDAQKEDSRD